MLKFNRDMDEAPFNQELLVTYVYRDFKDSTPDGEIHTIAFSDYQDDGNHIWMSYDCVLDEEIVGWLDTYENIE